MISSLSTAPRTETAEQRTLREKASQLESFVIKQLLTASGAFKGNTAVAGSSLTQEMFADTLSQAVAASGGLGLAPLLTKSMGDHQPATTPKDPGVTSAFGQRLDPITHEPSLHPGVDLGAAEGTPIPAARAGVVIAAGPRGGYGNAVEIQHDDGTSTLYAHASEVDVTPGMSVAEGEIIGRVGQTGRTTGPHLHLELRKAGHFVDPGQVLKTYRLRADKAGGGNP
jgi:murein DD-endopeptidase MepM/ murein hydrolase activator NlpD